MIKSHKIKVCLHIRVKLKCHGKKPYGNHMTFRLRPAHIDEERVHV